MEPTLRDGTYFKRLKFRDFIEKNVKYALLKNWGSFFGEKNAPAGILPVAPNL